MKIFVLYRSIIHQTRTIETAIVMAQSYPMAKQKIASSTNTEQDVWHNASTTEISNDSIVIHKYLS